MTYQAELDPDQSWEMAFFAREIPALKRLATFQKIDRPPGQPLPLRDAMRAIAKLGGCLGRKSDDELG